MPAPLDYKPIIQKLLDKSAEDKVPWEKPVRQFGTPSLPGAGQYDTFACTFEDGSEFETGETEDTYFLRMKDSSGDLIFSVSAQEEVLFDDAEKERFFNMLKELFELARRRALSVDQKLASVSSLLDTL